MVLADGETLGPARGPGHLRAALRADAVPFSSISVTPTDLAFNSVGIYGPGFLSTWTVGKSDIIGIDDFIDQFGGRFAQAQVRSNLTLTSIDTHSPIPEPGTMLLLGSGLFGVALRQRRA
jgi:hypothetical protein